MNSAVNSRKRKKQKKLKAQRLQESLSKEEIEEDDESSGHDVAVSDPKSRAQRLNAAGWDEEELGFTMDDLDKAMSVIEALGQNITAFKGPPFKKLRGVLHPLIEEQMKNYDLKGTLKRKRKDVADLQSLKEQDKEWINKAALRAKRLAALEELNKTNGAAGTLMITHMGEVEEAAEKIRVTRVPDGVAELDAAEEEVLSTQTKRLNVPISCYTCKRPFVELHFFYDQLCPNCAALNYSKRNEMVDLSGRVAIVTGARVKIGYRAALKLLRCGCTVIATSRFATDCAKRYSQESDFDDWKSRLQCYGIDFRDLGAVEQFCAWIRSKHARLDILINNACQTIRRPAQYYAHLMGAERQRLEDLPAGMQPLLHDNLAFQSAAHLAPNSLIAQPPADTDASPLPAAFVEVMDGAAESGGSSAAAAAAARGEGDAQPYASKPCSGSGPAAQVGAASRSSNGIHTDKMRACGAVGCDAAKDNGARQHQQHQQQHAAAAGADAPARSAAATATPAAATPAGEACGGGVEEGAAAVSRVGGGGKVRSAAEMSQMVVLEEDAGVRGDLFPQRGDAGGGALVDVNGQQVDLRRHNSWMLKLHEVQTAELVEVMAINAIAPAILNAKLKPLMEASPADWKFIVNVSAMEGKFYRWKTDQHPHTNMAKASLNMMTRTSAQDYVRAGIYMTAVDTGWINDEKPIEVAAAHGARHGFQTPLDEIDAAARVLDPVIAPLAARARAAAAGGGGGAPPVEEPPWGVFLKDFFKCEW